MSINTTQEIKCPNCSHLSDMTVWQSITVSDSSDLKEELLHGNVNIFKCPDCGQTALLPTPLLYNDEEKKLMISFIPCQDDSQTLHLYESVRQSSKASGELDGLEDYNLRFVTQYNDLLEKILIFDNNLHDKAIEVIKLLILMQDPEKADRRICIFGKCTADEIEFMVQDKSENQIYTSKVPMQTYNTVSSQLRQSGVKYKSFDWEMVNSEYAASLLRGTNNPL